MRKGKAKPGIDSSEARRRMETLRLRLLALHKALVDSERVQYEKTMGQIASASLFLKLLTSDPWFAWLSPLSQLVVAIDETLDGKKPLTSSSVEATVRQSSRMLVATETGSGFSKHYYEALQRDPDVVMAHAEVVRVLRR